MTTEELQNILYDMVDCPPEDSIDQREQLALYLSSLNERISKLERTVPYSSNIASCLANGVLPD